jgi:uncharacterized protein (TIRG00374 family)
MPRSGRHALMRWLPRSLSAFQLFRFALVITALAVLLLKVGRVDPLQRLAGAHVEFIAMAVVVVIVDGMVRAWNWWQLIRAMRIAPTVGYGAVLRIFWAGAFLGQAVPSAAGMDAMRAVLASRTFGGRVSEHAAAVVVLNMFGLMAGCTIGLAVAAWLFLTDPGAGAPAVMIVLFSGALSAAVTAFWLVHRQRGLLLCMLRLMRGPALKLRRGLRRFAQRLLIFDRSHVRIAPIVAVSLLTQAMRATMFALIGSSVGIVLPAGVWASLVPANMLSAYIPYSIGGYGGDQAALVYFVTAFGISAGSALAFALILPLMHITFNMLGGLCVLADHGASGSAIRIATGSEADET